MQHEIKERRPLLDKKGNILEAGWARDLLSKYHRKDICVSSLRIKEWDYYAVLNEAFGLGLTIADNGYMGFVSVTVFDFDAGKEISKTIMTPLPLGKFKLPENSETGDLHFSNKEISLYFKNEAGRRVLSMNIPDFEKGKSLKGTVICHKNEPHDSMVIATPFEKKGHFYFNQKINCMRSEGTYTLGEKTYDLGGRPSFAVLDWGRGVWTYNNTWYWGSASGEINGKLFGFNIGYGFGDTLAATENVIFYDGKAHKLEHVRFKIPKDSFMKPWTFSSSDKRFELTFEPVLDRASNAKVLFIQSDQHQVFGYFSGKVILDDGSSLKLDKFFGFAEKVMNKW